MTDWPGFFDELREHHRRELLGPLEPRPQWDSVARAVTVIERIVKSHPEISAKTDALQSYVRDTFDALGLSVRHEPTLYVAITTAGLMVEMASNAHDKGLIDHETLRAIASIAQSFTASLIDYLPKEARQ